MLKPEIGQWQIPDRALGRSEEFGSIMVVSGDSGVRHDCGLLLEALGYQPLLASNAAQSFEHIENLDISAALVDYELPDGDGLQFIKAIARLTQSRQQAFDSIVMADQPSVDLALRALRASATDFLEKPLSMGALSSSLMRIRAARAQQKLSVKISEDLGALRAHMQYIGNIIENASDEPDIRKPELIDKNRSIDASFVRKLIKAEYARSQVIGGKMMGDPAWNILLDLLLASLEGRKVAVSSACIVSGVATTTGLRLVNRMVDDGILIRIPDSNDGRRHFLGIDPTVEIALKSYLSDLAQL